MRSSLSCCLAALLSLCALVACGDDADPAPGGPGGGGEGPGGGTGAAGGTAGAGGVGGSGPEEEADILDQLRGIEGMSVEEQSSTIDGYRYFVMTFEQPADHADPAGVRFQQRLVLHHRDASAPFVLGTSGYGISTTQQRATELSALLGANQVRVEHRFFGPSRPEPADWSWLTIEQSSADLHRIVEVLRPLYEGPWISTGESKGGMTAVYHRRFYPDDVQATVAYVAPQSYGISDPRYPAFLAERGDPACRQALLDFQREILLRRPAMLALASEQATAQGLTYGVVGMEQALESAALEFIFTFWQTYGNAACAFIPTAAASDTDVWDFLGIVAGPSFWSDNVMSFYEPYYWQAAVQLGYPAHAEANVADLLVYPGFDVAASYVAPGKTPVFDPDAMLDIADWLATEGERMLFIYGEDDAYTAAAFDLGGAQDSYLLVEPGGTHGATLSTLTPSDRQVAFAALEAWTGVAPSPPSQSLMAPRASRWIHGDRWLP
ncbi:S28 family serine protease [Chondromyces crocatus]|uniref:Tripeptidyl aminopeptidase n=1 Tax=Chondromyces crocatus TaxID=52 RepID=A0A0K1EK66_CHOCO|nr:S28 family serine protease [Chondromyces crocatus]AKT41256.1 tripeptidyl aminopeptidase [Chondromyces crocatus]